MTDADRDPKQALLDAALPHVPFDGWTDATFRAAIADSGVEPALATALCPRGAVDLAIAYHKRGDAEMLRRLDEADLSDLRFRDRIAAAVRFRIEAAEDRELVRRGTTLFSLPQYAADGAKAIWETCDAIWTALGDRSEDVNWYTKRATLAGVYSATVLYWLGDDSPGHENTWAFLGRRVDNVLQIEKAKAQFRKSPLLKGLFAGPLWALGQVKAPGRPSREDLPGSLNRQHQEKQ